jgi:hypothetical protein
MFLGPCYLEMDRKYAALEMDKICSLEMDRITGYATFPLYHYFLLALGMRGVQ